MGNNAVITVRIDGKNIRAGASGLAFYPGSANSALRGVAITGFNAHGAFLLGAPSPVGPGTHGVTIAGNFIGTDGSGVGDDTSGLLANGASGVRVANYAHENLVGGATPADRNLIVASSGGAGISIDGAYNTRSATTTSAPIAVAAAAATLWSAWRSRAPTPSSPTTSSAP